MSRPKPDALPLGDGPSNIHFNTSKDFFLSKKYKVFINTAQVSKNKNFTWISSISMALEISELF